MPHPSDPYKPDKWEKEYADWLYKRTKKKNGKQDPPDPNVQLPKA